MTNNKMKYFTRLDGEGRRVNGSGVLRLSKPKTGSWVEDVVNVCCYAAFNVTLTVGDFTTDNTIALECNGNPVATFTVASSTPTTLQEFVDTLNTSLNYLGIFSTDGTDAFLKLKLEVANTLCPDPADITIDTSTV